LVAELARGGMGIVHLAESRGPGGFEKLVVVKELKRELADDPVYTAMFLDEARLAARLSHRHIVQTNEVGCEGGRYFMALELLEGGSLAQVRAKLGLTAMPQNVGLRVLAAVLDALDHAHDLTDDEGRALGVVHRDVSPQNVFLTFDGDVKLIDFGVAKSSDRRGQTKVGVVKGSVPYMSPDHVDGSIIDRRADVFAVGVILREMLVGERLWGDADDMTILRSLIRRKLPPLPASDAIPAALLGILARAMAPNRADRFPTAASMRDAIEAYLAEVDPRGSLDDLGTWLGTTLAAERTAFRAIVKKSRRRAPGRPQGNVPTIQTHVWLPSCDLATRYSGPPPLDAARRPAPARPKASGRGTPPRLRGFAAGALFAVALALVALVAQPKHDGRDGVTIVDRAPRAVVDPIAVNTSVTMNAREAAPEAVATAEDVAEVTAAVESSASRVPAAVLREPLPPNPYDPGE
jgi:serine/threonine-protein kinase